MPPLGQRYSSSINSSCRIIVIDIVIIDAVIVIIVIVVIVIAVNSRSIGISRGRREGSQGGKGRGA